MMNEKLVLDKMWFSAGSRCGHWEHLPPWSLLKALQNISYAQCSYCLWRRCVSVVGQGPWTEQVWLSGRGHFWVLGWNLPCPRDPLQHQSSSRKEAQALLYTCVSVVDAVPGTCPVFPHVTDVYRAQRVPKAGCSCWVQVWDGKHPSVVSCSPTLALHTESCCPYPAWPALCILVAPDTRPLPWSIPVQCQCARGPWAQLPVLGAGSLCSCLLFHWAP